MSIRSSPSDAADILYPLPPGYVLLDARKDRPLRRGQHIWSSETNRNEPRRSFGNAPRSRRLLRKGSGGRCGGPP